MVAVRQMPSSIGSVEFSMKKSALCSTKPRSVFDRAAAHDFHDAGSRRQPDQVRRRNDIQLHQEVGKIDIRCGVIDDDAHRAFGRVRANINHRTRKPIVKHCRHGNQHLAVEKASAPAALRFGARHFHTGKVSPSVRICKRASQRKVHNTTFKVYARIWAAPVSGGHNCGNNHVSGAWPQTDINSGDETQP